MISGDFGDIYIAEIAALRNLERLKHLYIPRRRAVSTPGSVTTLLPRFARARETFLWRVRKRYRTKLKKVNFGRLLEIFTSWK